MQERGPPGITLTRPAWCKEAAQMLLGGKSQRLAKLGIAGASGTSAGVGSAAVDFIAKFMPKESAAEAGWWLVWLALRDAVKDLADAHFSTTTAKDLNDRADFLQRVDSKVGLLNHIDVPPRTLPERPQDLPVLEAVEGYLERALVDLGTEPQAARAVAAQLPEHFIRCFCKRALQQPDRYAQLLALLESEPARALQQLGNWQAYASQLQRELDEPLFAGTYSLSDLYLPLRGYWTDRQPGEHGRSQQVRHAVYLAEDFDAWLEPFNKNDALRVVVGGPGSGKSSFVKCWAASVMQLRPMIRTLLVPLYHLTTPNFEGEIGDYAKSHLHFPTNPLDSERGERRLLLILDGLDELNIGGGDAAAQLVGWVLKLLSRNDNVVEIQVVLTGRALTVEGLRRELGREGRIYHVLGYAPCTVEAQWNDPAMLREIDQRQAWWEQWGKVSGDGSTGMPAEIASNENLADLADQPLLNHLLAIIWKDNPAALDSSSSRNSVYANLLRHVWERTWGEKRQIAAVKLLTVDEFNRLFEGIGLTVWQRGGRSTTLAEVAEVALQEKLDTVLPAFKEENKGALALLNAFFFRRAVSGETFQLTHKTFGEYLAARRLARLIEELPGRLQSGDIDEVEGLRLWYQPTHAARITQEIVTFLEGELRAREPDEVHAWRASLIQLFHRALQTGMAHESVDGERQPNQREAQRFDANAELALFATIGACTEAIVHGTADLPVEERRTRVRWSPLWPDRGRAVRTSAWDLLRRLEAGTAHDTVARRAMQGLDLNDQIIRGDLSEARLMFASARNSQLRRANLFRAELQGVDFFGADLLGANLSGADLGDAILRSATLTGANLIGAHFNGADLSSATINRAIASAADLVDVERRGLDSHGPDFSDAALIGTILTGSRLLGAVFTRSNLSGAKLDGTDLTRANFHEAIVRGADFSSANLSEAKLYKTDLRGAKLRLANLTGAIVFYAELNDANLEGANLEGADFSHAIGLTRQQLAVARNVDRAVLPDEIPEE